MKRLSPIVTFVLVAATLGAGRAAAQQPAGSGRVSLAARAGVFRPSNGTLSDVYPTRKTPLVVQADWRLLSRVAVFAGVRSVRVRGQAIVEGTGVAAGGGTRGAYDTRLTLTSGRAGALATWTTGLWDVRAGGGISVEHFRETWNAVGADTSGTRTGWLLQASLARGVWRRVAAVATVEYVGVTAPARSGEVQVPRQGLGGLDLTAGIAVRF